MTKLETAQISKEKKNNDPASVSSLHLSHRALSDVSCLKDFTNLERLDLSCNNLSTLEGLRSCVNLKWLSVVQNKLQSLKGIEDLSKLTVFNAGRNKISSMDEVRSLTNLRALILNDNEIANICKLDRLKNLNTLVLSRNPVHDIGISLLQVKSIKKLSFSSCKLQALGSSLVDCVDLKEVRLAHNEIMTLPTELSRNVKIQNLDIGNNVIQKWSDLKVISALHNLKNVNLQGNPITESDKLHKKIRKLLPNLQIFNGKPIEKSDDDKKISKRDPSSGRKDFIHGDAADIKSGKEEKRGKCKTSKKDSLVQLEDNDKSLNFAAKNVEDKEVEKHAKIKKHRKLKESEVQVIDDREMPFTEIISSSMEGATESSSKKRDQESIKDNKLLAGVVSISSKKKKVGKGVGIGHPALELFSSSSEVGMGGPSAWGDT